MTVKIRMGAALMLAPAAVAILILTAPDHFAAVHAALAAHATKLPKPPPLMTFASFMGLAAWLLVIHQQWRQRQFGWVVASFLLSYLTVITYAALSLFRPSFTQARNMSKVAAS